MDINRRGFYGTESEQINQIPTENLIEIYLILIFASLFNSDSQVWAEAAQGLATVDNTL